MVTLQDYIATIYLCSDTVTDPDGKNKNKKQQQKNKQTEIK